MIQIKAAVNALRDIDNLPKLRIQPTENVRQRVDGSSMPGNNGTVIHDLLDWLGAIFGFQVLDLFLFNFLYMFL